MQPKTVRSIILSAMLFIVALLVLGVISSQIVSRQLDEHFKWVTHTHEVIDTLDELLSTLKDAEDGQRGYLLTGSPQYLEPYEAALPRIDQLFNTLITLTQDNDIQQQSLKAISQSIKEKLQQLNETISIRKGKGLEPALGIVLTGKGKKIMDDIQVAVAEMKAREEKLLLARQETVTTSFNRLRQVDLYRSAMIVLLLLGVGWAFYRESSAERRDWLKTGISRINDALRGRSQISDLCQDALTELASYVGARVGGLFLLDPVDGEPVLKFESGYAYTNHGTSPETFRIGEGLIGQAAVERKQIVLRDVPNDYVKVCSGLGDTRPNCITLTPLIFDKNVTGVLELGFIRPPSELQMSYLEQIIPSISVNLETVKGREDLAKALAHSQALHEELQQQQEELRAANEELEEQTEELKTSHDGLRLQQEETEAINKELQEKNQHLDQQKKAIEQTNLELEQSQREIAEKAENWPRQTNTNQTFWPTFLTNSGHP